MEKYNNEEEFLANYNPKAYRTPDGYTADIALFTIVDKDEEDLVELKSQSKATKQLKIMLIKRAEKDAEGEPNIEGGKWALPGGFVQASFGSDVHETAYEAAIRELQEETGVKDILVKHFGTYDKPKRDRRGWIISNAHYAIVPEKYLEKRKAADDASDVQLFTMDEVSQLDLAFDHREIIHDAQQQIIKDMLQTNIAKEFLPKEFVASDLQRVLLAAYYHKSIDSDNFFKKIEKLEFIEVVKDKNNKPKTTARSTSKRPAKLYRFVGEAPLASNYF